MRRGDICSPNAILSSESPTYLIAISQRHLIVDPNAKFLDIHNRDKALCKNNFMKFTYDYEFQGGVVDEMDKTAYFVGECDGSFQRGFVIIQANRILGGLFHPGQFVPRCLPKEKTQNGTEATVQVGAEPHIRVVEMFPQIRDFRYFENKVFYCENEDISDMLCVNSTNLQWASDNVERKMLESFSGPISTEEFSKFRRRIIYIGRLVKQLPDNIYVQPVYPYLMEICKVTGICDNPSEYDGADSIAAELRNFIKVPDAVFSSVHPEIYSDYESADSDSNTDVENGQGELESGGNTVIFLDLPESINAEPSFISVIPEKNIPDSAPKDSIVVRAEPVSAIIIPLPNQQILGTNRTEYSSATELLIAFLIIVALFFYVCMCLHGCVEYRGVPVYWRPDSGRLPA
ncbi:unnamed protein product [Caenorhabditis sp. 36 PRJEB53466]|nr:unnamed protein product [Caenorhabditis sp. 36 PRJEB53466]